MALPRKVQEAGDTADALLKMITEGGNEEVNKQEPATEPAEPQEPQDVDTGSQGLSVETAGDGDLTGQQEPEDHKQDDSWEHRYKVLSGKYNAEVPRLAAENRDLKGRLTSLEAMVEGLKNAPPAQRESLVKPEEVEEYGDGLVDLIRRAARDEISSKDAEINELRLKLDTFQNTANKSVEINFYDDLANRVPDWVSINDDDGFLKWLEEYDELTGQRRQDLLSQAEGERDARRVANFFLTWKRQNETRQDTANRKLEAQAVPKAARAAETPSSGRRTYTRAEISEFYAKARRGEISAKDMVAVETEIQKAMLENRIR